MSGNLWECDGNGFTNRWKTHSNRRLLDRAGESRKKRLAAERATPPSKRRRHGREGATVKKPDCTTLQERINKFPCEARLKGRRGGEAQECWQLLQETD